MAALIDRKEPFYKEADLKFLSHTVGHIEMTYTSRYVGNFRIGDPLVEKQHWSGRAGSHGRKFLVKGMTFQGEAKEEGTKD